MNRYYVFRYSMYYPEGGMNDCVFRTKSLEEAVARAVHERDENCYYANVWDVLTEGWVSLPVKE